jgi:beta-glucanase (GH16 family)
MFTWLCSTVSCSTTSSNVQEADIEILTDGPRNKIQLTNQPSESPSGDTLTKATLNATLPGEVDWTVWNEYRYDWLPGMSTWYVNGAQVGSISFQAPKDPSGIIINMWSNGGSWTGNMSVDGASYLQIQWIQLVYNTSGPVEGAAKVDSKELNLAKRSSMLATSEVSEQFSHSPEELNVHAPLQSRADASGASCFRVCSVDTNVTTVGTTVVVSIARQETAGYVTLSLIFWLLMGIWVL